MRQLGVSIYPNSSDEKTDEQYLTKAEGFGFRRVFMSMLEAKNVSETINKFKRIIQFANNHGFQVTLDVAPRIFKALGVSYTDLNFFKELGVSVLRLDQGFDGITEANLSYNPEGIIIELNMSNNTGYLANILSYQANEPFIYGCHNFYPQIGTGLSDDFFLVCSKSFKSKGIHTAAFVSSNVGTIGPWNVNDGLPTRESDRGLPIDVQAKSLFMTGLIDDVIIGNAYASDQELENLSKLNKYKLTLGVNFVANISEVERKIVLSEPHYRRGDSNALVARSTMSRVKYRDVPNAPHDNTKEFQVGDIVVGNDDFGVYKNELQLVLQPHSDVRKNKVGAIKSAELPLLGYVYPWTKFEFVN